MIVIKNEDMIAPYEIVNAENWKGINDKNKFSTLQLKEKDLKNIHDGLKLSNPRLINSEILGFFITHNGNEIFKIWDYKEYFEKLMINK